MTRKRYANVEFVNDVVRLEDNGHFKDYDEDKLEELLNYFEDIRKRKGKEIAKLKEINRLCFEVIDGVKAYIKLKEMGWIWDE